jgi:K+-transporting ATPase A subunit
MTKNMGSTDRVIRVLVALCLALLYFTGRVGGTLGIIFLIVAAVFLLTSLMGSCPGYLPLGISTCGKSKGSSPQA